MAGWMDRVEFVETWRTNMLETDMALARVNVGVAEAASSVGHGDHHASPLAECLRRHREEVD